MNDHRTPAQRLVVKVPGFPRRIRDVAPARQPGTQRIPGFETTDSVRRAWGGQPVGSAVGMTKVLRDHCRSVAGGRLRARRSPGSIRNKHRGCQQGESNPKPVRLSTRRQSPPAGSDLKPIRLASNCTLATLLEVPKCPSDRSPWLSPWLCLPASRFRPPARRARTSHGHRPQRLGAPANDFEATFTGTVGRSAISLCTAQSPLVRPASSCRGTGRWDRLRSPLPTLLRRVRYSSRPLPAHRDQQRGVDVQDRVPRSLQPM